MAQYHSQFIMGNRAQPTAGSPEKTEKFAEIANDLLLKAAEDADATQPERHLKELLEKGSASTWNIAWNIIITKRCVKWWLLLLKN